MTRKASVKNKKKWTKLIQNANAMEMDLNLLLSLLEQRDLILKSERNKRKYGEYLNWPEAYCKNGMYLSIPIYSKKDNLPTGNKRVIFNMAQAKEIIPPEYEFLLKQVTKEITEEF